MSAGKPGYRIYLCGGPEAAVPDDSDCPNNHDHTPAPKGYIAWHEWAAEMAKTHLQTRCVGCGLLKVLVPK